MKNIPLTQNKYALVDDEDYQFLNSFRWCAHHTRTGWRAMRRARLTDGTSKIVYMHRIIMLAHEGEIVDHRDHSGLNNTKINLRTCTNAENIRNSPKPKNNTSGYKGVFWSNQSNKWAVQIMYNRKGIHVGLFDDIVEAAKAYNEAALKYHGEFACINPRT